MTKIRSLLKTEFIWWIWCAEGTVWWTAYLCLLVEWKNIWIRKKQRQTGSKSGYTSTAATAQKNTGTYIQECCTMFALKGGSLLLMPSSFTLWRCFNSFCRPLFPLLAADNGSQVLMRIFRKICKIQVHTAQAEQGEILLGMEAWNHDDGRRSVKSQL